MLIIETQSVCGKLNGNGNGMDFLSCLLIKSELSVDEIYNLYWKTSFKTAKKRSDSVVEFEVVEVKENRLVTEFLTHGEVAFEKLRNVSDFSDYYAIVIYDGGYSADFDIRGH